MTLAPMRASPLVLINSFVFHSPFDSRKYKKTGAIREITIGA